MSQPDPQPYLMGHTDHERRRLSLQGSILNPLMEAFLMRAGISRGMRVLDLGCGVGEISLIAARAVGPDGRVVGIDKDATSLEIGRRRAAEENLTQLTFEDADLQHHRTEHPYDAVIGRHILVHVHDPVAVLRASAAMLRSGGIVAFQEGVFDGPYGGDLVTPTARRLGDILREFFLRSMRYADIGLRLYMFMQEAGLPAPQCRIEGLLEGGPDSLYYEWYAETMRSLLPSILAAGLATAEELDVDTLAERMRAEAVELRMPVFAPPMVSAFTRV